MDWVVCYPLVANLQTETVEKHAEKTGGKDFQSLNHS